jgi:hypothetical protein
MVRRVARRGATVQASIAGVVHPHDELTANTCSEVQPRLCTAAVRVARSRIRPKSTVAGSTVTRGRAAPERQAAGHEGGGQEADQERRAHGGRGGLTAPGRR